MLLCYEKYASTISYFFNKKVYDGGVDNYGRHDYYCEYVFSDFSLYWLNFSLKFVFNYLMSVFKMLRVMNLFGFIFEQKNFISSSPVDHLENLYPSLNVILLNLSLMFYFIFYNESMLKVCDFGICFRWL